MAMWQILTFWNLYILLMCSSEINGSKLNVPRILLPIFNDFSVNFTLEATESGCYKWYVNKILLRYSSVNTLQEYYKNGHCTFNTYR